MAAVSVRARKMRAAVLRGPQRIKMETLPVPKLGVNDVLVKVKAVGVCGSDVAYYGRGRADVPPPIVLGHEFTGEIAELGPTAKKLGLLKKGDRVVAEPVQSCGVCSACKSHMPNLCEKPVVLGVSVNGGFAEYCSVFHNYVHLLPDNVSYEEGAFTEPLACAIYGINKLQIELGDFAVVLGPGPIGIMMAQYIKSSGASEVALIGTRDYRLEMGKKLGANHILNTGDKRSKYYSADPLTEIKRLTDNRGADKVIVATGNVEANQLGARLGGPRSKTVFFGGASYGPDDFIKVYLWEGTLGDKEFLFSWLSPYTFRPALKAISSGLVKVKPLITHSFPLQKTGEAIETAEKRVGNAIKVQVKP